MSKSRISLASSDLWKSLREDDSNLVGTSVRTDNEIEKIYLLLIDKPTTNYPTTYEGFEVIPEVIGEFKSFNTNSPFFQMDNITDEDI